MSEKNAEALQARLDELEAWRQDQFQLITARSCASDEEVSEQLKEIYQLNDAHMCKVAQAHKEFGIPFLQHWIEALSLADKAEYRAPSLYPEQTISASLQRDEAGRVTFTMVEQFRFPAEWSGALTEYDLLPDRYIRNRLPRDNWEAVEPEPKPDIETHNEGAYHDVK